MTSVCPGVAGLSGKKATQHTSSAITVTSPESPLWRCSNIPNSTSTGDLLRRWDADAHQPKVAKNRLQAPCGVRQVPERVSPRRRNCVAQVPNPRPTNVVYLPNPMWKACTELAHVGHLAARDSRGIPRFGYRVVRRPELAPEQPNQLWAHEDLNLGPLPCQGIHYRPSICTNAA